MRGLSCTLFPFLPLRPQRLVNGSSALSILLDVFVDRVEGFPEEDLFLGSASLLDVRLWSSPPPSIAETEDWAQRAFLRIAEVMVIHSVVIKATGSTAMVVLVDWANEDDR